MPFVGFCKIYIVKVVFSELIENQLTETGHTVQEYFVFFSILGTISLGACWPYDFSNMWIQLEFIVQILLVSKLLNKARINKLVKHICFAFESVFFDKMGFDERLNLYFESAIKFEYKAGLKVGLVIGLILNVKHVL